MSHDTAILRGSWRAKRDALDAKGGFPGYPERPEPEPEPDLWPDDLCGDVVILDGDGVTDALRGAIEESGYTNYRIAQASGVAERTVSRFLSGDRLISSSFDKLCATFRLVLCIRADDDEADGEP